MELTGEHRERITASLTIEGVSDIGPAWGHAPMQLNGESGFKPHLEDTSKGVATAVVFCDKYGFLRHPHFSRRRLDDRERMPYSKRQGAPQRASGSRARKIVVTALLTMCVTSMVIAQAGAADMMMDGQSATLSSKATSWMCQATKEKMDAFIDAVVKKDRYGMAEAMTPGGIFLKPGWKVRSIGHAGFLGSSMRIRIESGPEAGGSCWLPSDAGIFKNIH